VALILQHMECGGPTPLCCGIARSPV
jgi:hypothetical protein